MAAKNEPGMRYLNFDLEIGLGQGREYPLRLLESPAGEAEEVLYFPFDELALENRLKDVQIALLRSSTQRRQALTAEEQSVQEFGQALFHALFTGEVRSRFDVSRQRAKDQGFGLRLRLRIDPPELASLPWEFLYDPRQRDYICFSRSTPLVRYVERPLTSQALSVQPPLRILGMVSSPPNLPPLDIRREKERLERALKNLKAAGLVEPVWLEGQTWRDLQSAMRRGPWHVFHFIGHGGFDEQADEGLLMLAEEEGSYKLTATQLTRLLVRQESLRLAVLNTCEGGRGSKKDIFSSTASILVGGGIPAVIAMQDEISDRAAIEFGHAFYASLADSLPVDAALAEARLAISMAFEVTAEWATPVLYMRSSDGMLFTVDKSTASPQPGQVVAEEPRKVEPAGKPPRTTALDGSPHRLTADKPPIFTPTTVEPEPARTQVSTKVDQKEAKEESVFYRSPIWWGITAGVLGVSILVPFLVNWGMIYAFSVFNVELNAVRLLWIGLLAAGLLWGIIYVLMGLADEASEFSSLFGLLISYAGLGDAFDFGEFLGSFISAMPVNFILSLGLAYGGGWAASNYLGADYTGVFYIIYVVVSLIELVTGLVKALEYI